MDKRLRLPALPPVPTEKMTKGAKVGLVGDIRSVPKDEMWRWEVQEYVKQCYARVWISLCLDKHIKPPAAASWTSAGHKAVLPGFVRAATAIGVVQAETIADWYAPEVARLAARLWSEATAPPSGECAPGPTRLAWATSAGVARG